MGSPPQDEDSTRPTLPRFWQFYFPKPRELVSIWWWAANFHNDLVAAALLTVTAIVTLAWSVDALGILGEYANVLAPWLPRLSAGFLIVLLVYAFLRVNYQRFMALEAAVRAEAQRSLEEGLSAKQRQLAEWTMERDATMSKVTSDWNARATQLGMEVAERDAQLTAVRAEAQQDASERDEARTELRVIKEARPLLRLEPYRLHGVDNRGETVEWQARLRVTNERPSVMVRDCYAQIVEWGEAPDGEWQPEVLREREGGPYSHAGPLVQAETNAGNFQRETEFIVATIGHRHRIAYFGMEESLKHRYRLHIGVWAVKLEVGASNLGTEPVSRWFRLAVVVEDGEARPNIDLWDELNTNQFLGEEP